MDDIDDRFEQTLCNSLRPIREKLQADQRLLAAYDELHLVTTHYLELEGGCNCDLGFRCFQCRFEAALASVDRAQPAAVLS